MSKLAWAALLFAGAAAGLVAYLLTRPLPESVVAIAAEHAQKLDERAAQLAASEQALTDAIAEDPAYLEPVEALKEGRAELAARRAALTALRARYDAEVKPLLEANRHSDGPAVLALSADITAASNAIAPPSPSPADQAQAYLRYKRDYDQIVDAARGRIRAANQGPDADPLASAVSAAQLECPDLKDKLSERLAAIQAARTKLVTLGQQLETRVATPPKDPIAIGTLADQIAQEQASWTAARTRLRTSLTTLTQSEDVVLTDMKAEKGQYAHRYDTYLDGEVQHGDWQAVNPTKYTAHRDHLGMAISSKPACVLAEDATRVAAPPGYSYIGNPRYGKWETRGGDRFWVFYGRYALMRDVLWGRGYYRPVSHTSWRRYDGARRAGRSYYGDSNQYGSRGTRTRVRYAGSTYVKRGRTPSSSSSRKYSGSKYSGSSGSRSGGFKGSRYRGRSFGGSGK